MPRWLMVLIAFLLAIAATVMGFFESILWKHVPLVPLALWFPVVVLTESRSTTMLAWAFVQYPLFATAFALGIRRWPIGRVLLVIVLVYALMAGLALMKVRSVYGVPAS